MAAKITTLPGVQAPDLRCRLYLETGLALCNKLDHDLTGVIERQGRRNPEIHTLIERIQQRVLEIADVVSAGWASNEQIGRPLVADEIPQEVAL